MLRQALKDEVLSINPLELLTCAMTLGLVRYENAVLPQHPSHLAKRQHVYPVRFNNDRAKPIPMLEALLIVREESDMTFIRVHGQHITADQMWSPTSLAVN